MVDETVQPPTPDPAAILRSRSFVVLLVFAAAIGIVVSLVGWGFLELVHQIQVWVFTDLPKGLGLDPVPSWWALPVCTLAGLPVAYAVARLPGNGGHVPANGLQVGSTEPNVVPGVALAALATLGLGLVLGPEAPLIAIGSGVAVATVRLAKRDAPPTMLLVLGAAGAFAAISVIFGSPIVGAVIIIEASGLGGATLPLILIPGLIAGGIGSLVFIGMAHWTGLSTAAYSLPPLQLAPLGTPTWEEIGWTILLGLAAALLTYPIRNLGLRTARLVPKREFLVIPIAGFTVAMMAFVFAQITDHSAYAVLFSGQESIGTIVKDAGTLSVGTLIYLVLFKSMAWAISLGSFRGGPIFPALLIGAAGGIALSHLPGLSSSVAVPVCIGAMFVAFLRLPLSAIIIASALCASAGAGAEPLIIVGVVVAYLATLAIEGRLGAPGEPSTQPATAG
jgi:H+/Cl- antiporter ClcA